MIEEIERFAREEQVDMLDACITYAEKNGVDLDFLAGAIRRDAAFKAKLQAECEELHILGRIARLPI